MNYEQPITDGPQIARTKLPQSFRYRRPDSTRQIRAVWHPPKGANDEALPVGETWIAPNELSAALLKWQISNSPDTAVRRYRNPLDEIYGEITNDR